MHFIATPHSHICFVMDARLRMHTHCAIRRNGTERDGIVCMWSKHRVFLLIILENENKYV